MTLIEINLLDADGEGSGGGFAGVVARYGARVRAFVSDPYLAGAVAAVVLALGGGGALYAGQARAETAVGAREATATADSARYAALLAARRAAMAERRAAVPRASL